MKRLSILFTGILCLTLSATCSGTENKFYSVTKYMKRPAGEKLYSVTKYMKRPAGEKLYSVVKHHDTQHNAQDDMSTTNVVSSNDYSGTDCLSSDRSSSDWSSSDFTDLRGDSDYSSNDNDHNGCEKLLALGNRPEYYPVRAFLQDPSDPFLGNQSLRQKVKEPSNKRFCGKENQDPGEAFSRDADWSSNASFRADIKTGGLIGSQGDLEYLLLNKSLREEVKSRRKEFIELCKKINAQNENS